MIKNQPGPGPERRDWRNYDYLRRPTGLAWPWPEPHRPGVRERIHHVLARVIGATGKVTSQRRADRVSSRAEDIRIDTSHRSAHPMQPPFVPRSVVEELIHWRRLEAGKMSTWAAIVHLATAARLSLGMALIRAGRSLGGRPAERASQAA